MTADRRAWAVVDLGFGDAGKGTTTDHLVRRFDVSLVVRFNGGAQAGHNVVLADGRHHTFAQFGSGTFVPGVRTHLGPAFVMHPGGLLVEARVLADKGVGDAMARLTVDGRVRLVTPFQQAAGRLRELVRGPLAHGTTGVGVGEAVRDALHTCDDVLVAADLSDPERIRRQLRRQQARKFGQFEGHTGFGAAFERELAVLQDPDVVERVVEAWAPLRVGLTVLEPERARTLLDSHARVVCEGAQGVLLDERFGFHPHTTWSDCTFAGAAALMVDRTMQRLGVTRAFTVRHGPGPMPTYDRLYTEVLAEPHNPQDGWQGRFRVGPLDLVLLRYAVDVVGGVDGMAVTWLDRCAEVPLEVCTAYDDGGAEVVRLIADHVDHELPGSSLTALLERVGVHRVRLGTVAALVDAVAQAGGAPVVLASYGPRSDHKIGRETFADAPP